MRMAALAVMALMVSGCGNTPWATKKDIQRAQENASKQQCITAVIETGNRVLGYSAGFEIKLNYSGSDIFLLSPYTERKGLLQGSDAPSILERIAADYCPQGSQKIDLISVQDLRGEKQLTWKCLATCAN